jgi:hypothetical protein
LKTPLAAIMFRSLCFVVLLCPAHGYTQLRPQPPCGETTVPPYPALDNSPVEKFWSESEFGRDWRPPACTNWADAGFSTLTTTVARFRYTSGAQGLLRRMPGQFRSSPGMRYWSTTHQQWQTLIVSAHALTGPQPKSTGRSGLHAR